MAAVSYPLSRTGVRARVTRDWIHKCPTQGPLQEPIAIALRVYGIGIIAVWLGFRIAEAVHQIALVSTGAIALTWGFFISPDELQLALAAASLGGGLVKLRASHQNSPA